MRISTCSLFLLLCYLTACQKEAPKVGEIINSMRRAISPRSVDIGGIRFYQSRVDIEQVVPFRKCDDKGLETMECSWKRTPQDSKNFLEGIDQLKLTFFRDTLKTLRAEYGQMFDVEYVNFEKAIRSKYAYAIAGHVIDTSGNDWLYDSLKITLIPNKKQHWTGSFFAFTPVLEFEERTVVKRWLDEVEKQKIKKVY